MEIVGYIVQYYHEDTFMPETGYKHLHKSFQKALENAKARVLDYTNHYPHVLIEPFESHTPSKKQADNDGYVIIFRNAELQVWIEVIITN